MTRSFALILIGALAPFSLPGEEPDPTSIHRIPASVDSTGKLQATQGSVAGKPVVAPDSKVPQGSSPEETFENAVKQFFDLDALTKSKEGQYYVRVQINGKERWMAFDSGVEGILVDNDIAREDAIEVTPGGNTKSPNGVLKTFKIGSTAFDGIAVTFTDLSASAGFTLPDGSRQRSSGRTGTAFIQGIPMVMDAGKSRLLVRKAEIQGGLASLQEQLGFVSTPLIDDKKGHHYLETQLMGWKGLFLIDTGDASNTVYENVAKSLNLETSDDKAGRKTVSVRGFRVGDHALQGDVDLLVEPMDGVDSVDDLPVFGRVGIRFLEATQCTVDFGNNQLAIPKSLMKPSS